jgi:hypothetical protein
MAVCAINLAGTREGQANTATHVFGSKSKRLI